MEINTTFAWKKENSRNNSPLLPEDIRGLIVGTCNSGKTTLLLNLLLYPGWLDYDHLFVFGRSLHQREYVIIKKELESGLSKEQISNLKKDTQIQPYPHKFNVSISISYLLNSLDFLFLELSVCTFSLYLYNSKLLD